MVISCFLFIVRVVRVVNYAVHFFLPFLSPGNIENFKGCCFLILVHGYSTTVSLKEEHMLLIFSHWNLMLSRPTGISIQQSISVIVSVHESLVESQGFFNLLKILLFLVLHYFLRRHAQGFVIHAWQIGTVLGWTTFFA